MEKADFERLVLDELEKGEERLAITFHRRLSADLVTPVSTLLSIAVNARYAFLFESVEGGEKLARYSFLAKNPYLVLRAFGEFTFSEQFKNGASQPGATVDLGETIFEALRKELQKTRQVSSPGLPRFTSGAVGYVAYDAIRLIEKLPDSNEDEVGMPDAVFCFYDSIVAFDHVKHQLVLMHTVFVDKDSSLDELFEQGQAGLTTLASQIQSGFDLPEKIELQGATTTTFSKSDFESAVSSAKANIRDGDIFQVVLSRRTSQEFSGHPVNLYRTVRQINPSPYLFYMRLDDATLVGSSPELLVRVEDGQVETLPIAGTRPRGENDADDTRFEAELLADAKERAEHLMLVDLGRNDIGKVCVPGTVHVDKFSSVEHFSHVMHLVSSVKGRLRPELHAIDALQAAFPAGTVSGAPKVKAMEIIDHLEPVRRGAYAGAVGYLDFSGNMDTCIAIRTIVARENQLHIQAGAGIVADSKPEHEFIETVNKAKALLEAVQRASGSFI